MTRSDAKIVGGFLDLTARTALWLLSIGGTGLNPLTSINWAARKRDSAPPLLSSFPP